jgi:hypothetical protein
MHYFLFVWPTAHQFSVELRSSEMTALVMAGAACRVTQSAASAFFMASRSLVREAANDASGSSLADSRPSRAPYNGLLRQCRR